jgi:hypothetical protein
MKLMATFETHVFTNEGGGVTIRQKCWPEDDVTVVLCGDQIELVMLELQRLLTENKFTMEMPEEEE